MIQSGLCDMVGGLPTSKTLLDAIFKAPRDQPFVTMHHPGRCVEDETFTFGRFLGLAQHFAVRYQKAALRQGEPVVLIIPQGILLMAGFIGAILVGAVPTILAYPTFKVDPQKYQRGLAGVTKNIKAHLIVLDRALSPEFIGHIFRNRETCLLQVDEQMYEPVGEKPAFTPANASDVAFLQHSAGTTGLQKGVALSHRTILNQLRNLVSALRLTRQDRIVSWLPLYHDMGLIACFILPLVCHLRVVMQSPTDWILRPGSFLQLASRYRCTLCWLPNFAFQFMARRVPPEECGSLNLSPMRVMINTSEPARAQSMEEFYQVYRSSGLSRTSLQTSYGMAENTFAVTQSTVDGVSCPRTIWVERNLLWSKGKIKIVTADHPAAISLVACGRHMDSNMVRVVAKDGSDLPEGHQGEILVHSDSLFEGYYNRPDLTRKVLRDGWYWTGDGGFVLEGELYVIGRQDDVVIVAGKNLYPQDVEEIVCSDPHIHDGRAVAFGLYNPELGTEDLVVVGEVHDEEDLKEKRQISTEIRARILAEIEVVAPIVYLVPPRWVVKSTAGKPARSTNRCKFLRENPKLNNTDSKGFLE